MRKFIFLSVLVVFLSSCNKKYAQEYKSPCVSNGGPCKHIPVNNWWLPDELKYNGESQSA